MDIFEESVNEHKKMGGKMEIRSKITIENTHDLSIAYTPGVAGVCQAIVEDPSSVYDLTFKKNSVAVVTDGSAVLGLGNIGSEASLPVMEGKCILFKQYAGIDAVPIALATQDTNEIVKIVTNIAPAFGGINLEDIAAPRCFEIENRLQDLGIPVFHDDQHGTAITLFGALINASKLAGKPLESLKCVINGAGAAGTAIAEILMGRVQEILVCDSEGIISKKTICPTDHPEKFKLAALTNKNHRNGNLKEAMAGADVFIGVSVGNVVTKDMVAGMADKSIVFAMANPIPEIHPDDARDAGAFIVGTGRSDHPNQVNNVLIFPGIFKGAMAARAPKITDEMKIQAAFALADSVEVPTVDYVLPSVLDKSVAEKVALAVESVARKAMVHV
jgi:malate dehydrogenase (oxaloacetate-decarboxylating)